MSSTHQHNHQHINTIINTSMSSSTHQHSHQHNYQHIKASTHQHIHASTKTSALQHIDTSTDPSTHPPTTRCVLFSGFNEKEQEALEQYRLFERTGIIAAFLLIDIDGDKGIDTDEFLVNCVAFRVVLKQGSLSISWFEILSFG
jgi:hypothetical protein